MSEVPFEVPPTWTWRTLQDVALEGPSNGYSPASGPNATGTWTLRLSATTGGTCRLDDETTKRVFETIDSDSSHWLEPGDLLIQRANTLEYVGTAAVFRGPSRQFIYPDLMMRVRVDPAIVDCAYVARFLSLPGIRQWLRDRATGTAGNMPKVNGATVRAVPVAVPPLAEQRRIVAKLEDLLARSKRAKEALDAIPPLLETLRRSILAAAFRGDLTAEWREKHPDVEPADRLLARIRVERRKKWEEAELARLRAKGKAPTDDRWKEKYREPEPVDASGLPELPEGWAWASLDAVSERITDGTHQPPPLAAEGIPFIGIRNIVGGRIAWDTVDRWVSRETWASLSERCPPVPGDLLYTAVGATFGTAVVIATPAPFLFQRHIAHVKLLRGVLDPWFAEHMMNSPQVFAQARLAARGAAQPTVTLGELARFVIPVPPMTEQEVVVHAIARAHEKVQHAEGTVGGAVDLERRLVASVLSSAFRGELVPQDPNDEPADVMLARLAAEQAAPARAAKPSRGKAGPKTPAKKTRLR